ncbi:Nn.00g085520.m01.CDS01 [Neocucurbitaria sp. VM-36]
MSLPSRLLDLSALPERKDLLKFQGDPRSVFAGKSCKLVENGLTSTGQYVALSYCWGKSLAYTTTTTNLVAHKQEQGIKYDNLPKTLQDALFLVRYLGLQYLWADCVCIVQDDKADWEHEAARMADVYSNAYLTIAATRASHCGEGFLQPRKIKSRQSTPFEDEDGSFELYFDYDDCTTSPGSMQTVTYQPLRLHKGEPLLERVWCFQERVLATRTLHFASDKMYWECAQCFETEEGIVNDHEEDFYKEYSMEKIASGLKNAAESEDPNASRDAWFRLIQEYTSRNMTYQSDKLPALSGIISALQIITGDICYAGIWRSWFMKGLLWRLQVPEWDMYVFTPKQPSQVGFYRAPSWSFASIEGVVLYNEVDRVDAWNFCAQLEDCSVTSKGNNPLGELESGFARITGPVTSIVSVAQGVTQNGRTGMVCLRDQRLVAAAVYFDFDRYDSCQVLMITPHTGIAISPVGEDKDTFVRVGAVSVYPLWDDIELFRASEKPDRFLTPSAFPQPRSITII